MMKPIQKQRTFTRNNFAEHNYKYVNRPQTSKSFRPNNQNHLFSQHLTTNLVKFHNYPRILQDQSENYPFFQQNKNNKQQNQNKTPYYTPNYLSSDDDDHYQPDLFAPYTQDYRVQQPRPSLASQNTNFYLQNLASTQTHQPLQAQNPTSTQPYQTIQIQNPVNTDYYQLTLMQNEIPPLIIYNNMKSQTGQLANFSKMPNAAESLQMTMNPYLMGGSPITSNKPLMVFTGTDPEYSVEDYLNALTVNIILNIGPEPKNTPLHQN